MTHWAMNDFRSDALRTSLETLIDTTKHLPVEIILVDNGQNINDSLYLLDLVHRKKIQFYVRNSENLYFGFGRNQGASIACGEYIVFTDNDIGYKGGWLEKCVAILETFPERKIAVTPLRTDRQHRNNDHWNGFLEFGDEKILLNMRAGSNSWVMRRKDFNEVGGFINHHIAGSKWTDVFCRKGYLMATMEKEPLASDIGFKRGYSRKYEEMYRVFANGEKLKINGVA